MNVLLSSFGFTLSSDLFKDTYCFRMPPVCLATGGHCFVPEYSVFLLFDNYFIDSNAIANIQENPYFQEHVLLLSGLKELGRLKVIDFESIITPYKNDIKKSVAADLNDLTSWIDAFSEAVEEWNQFETIVSANPKDPSNLDWRYIAPQDDKFLSLVSQGMVQGLDSRLIVNLKNWNKKIKKKYRDFTKTVVSGYLEHVAVNMYLSELLDAKIHDWSDIGPLYKEKFIRSCSPKGIIEINKQEKCRLLFNLCIPELKPQKTEHFIELLNDDRITDVRNQISKAASGEIDFDGKYIQKIINEISLNTIFNNNKKQKLHGYCVSIINEIPLGSFLGKILENKSKERHEKQTLKNHDWFILLNDVARYRNQ